MTAIYHSDGGIPNIALIGVADQQELIRVVAKLKDNRIPHYAYSEPDYDFGLTAICTAPISGIQRQALRHFKIYREGTTNEQVACERNLNFPANTPVAQQTECSSLQREVVG